MSKNSIVQSHILSNMLFCSPKNIAKKWLMCLSECNETTTDIIQLTKTRPPLFYAIQSKADNSLILILLRSMQQHKIKLNNIYDKNGYSMLTFAVKNNNIQLVKLLLNYDYPLYWDRNKRPTSALHIAAQYNRKDIINFMLPYTTRQLNIHSENDNNISSLKYLLYNREEKYAINLLVAYPPRYDLTFLDKNNYLSVAKQNNMLLLIEFLNFMTVALS